MSGLLGGWALEELGLRLTRVGAKLDKNVSNKLMTND